MSGAPTLSAVARRRAAKLENASTSDSPQAASNNAKASSPGPAPPLSLKRKTSARSLKQTENPGTSSSETQCRKKIKAPGYPQAHSVVEPQDSLSASPRRAYSPSQPLLASSEEDEVTTPPDELESSAPSYGPRLDVEHDMAPMRIPDTSRNILSLVDGQNCFPITPEQTLSITKRLASAKVLLLSDEGSLLFVGSMRLMVLQGSIRLLGVPLLPSTTSHRVFAPRSHPIPVLEVAPKSSQNPPSEEHSKALTLTSNLPENIRQCISATHAVVIIQELSTGVENLGRVVQPFANVFEPDPRDTNSTEQVLKGLYVFKSEPQLDTTFHLPSDWESALNTITATPSSSGSVAFNSQTHNAPVVLVKGGKNSGKSTFSRMLANCLTNRYRRVAFIECDLGQSEFTPGGIVSLNIVTSPIFGPPFTHLGQPRRAHFVGGNSPKTSPSYYLSALNDLAQCYQLDLKYSTGFYEIMEEKDSLKDSATIPLVINTQGWVKGMGADLLRAIEDLFGPTHVVEFQLPQTPSSLDILPNRHTLTVESTNYHQTDTPKHLIKLLPIPPPSRAPRFSAADLRSLAFASYFYGRFPSNNSDDGLDELITHWDTSFSLRSVAPIAIDIRSALEGIIIVAPAGDDVVPDELPRALVCGIVGLVAPDSPSTLPETAYIPGALPPPPQNSRCVGLGFIRGASDTQLHLLTPTPVSQLTSCRTIVLGELSMPIWAFLDLHTNETGETVLPFLQWGRSIAENAGGERRRVRRNLMRRGQA